MKILCLVSENDLPESEMIVALAESGLDISVVIEPESRYIQKYRDAGIEVFPLKLRGRIDIKGISAIRQLIKQGQFSILHSFSKKALSNALLAARGLPVKCIGYRGIVGNLSLFDPGSWLTFLSPRLDRVVCVCRAIEEYMKNFSSLRGKVSTIYKGHSLSWYDSKQAMTRSSLEISSDIFLLSCICNIRPRKGLKILLDALEQLPPDIHLLLVGRVDDPELEQRLRSSKLKDRVYFQGYQPDAWRYSAISDLFVMPSLRREGLPKGVIEAMACGVPAVVTNVGGMPEIVEHNISGKIVGAGSSLELVEAILSYYEDRSQLGKHGAQARDRIGRDFNLNQTVVAYRNLYQDLLGEARLTA